MAAFSRIGSLDEFRLPDCFSGVLQTLRLYQYANFDYTFLRFVHIFFSFFGVCRCSRFIFYLRCVSCFESHWYSTFNFYKSSSSQPTFLLFCQVLFKHRDLNRNRRYFVYMCLSGSKFFEATCHSFPEYHNIMNTK